MHRLLHPLNSLLLLGIAPAAVSAAPPVEDSRLVRLYRCAGTGGTIALQDSPCQAGHVQQVIERQRPRDPSAAAITATIPSSAPAAAPAILTRTVTVAAPEPLYECVTADGVRYTADNGEGNPRWVSAVVPVWVPAEPHGSRPPSPRPPAGRNRPSQSPIHGQGSATPSAGLWTGVPTGQWVRDTCQLLTRQEACERLSGQRWEMVSRYNSALQGELQQLVTDQRRLEERMERMQCRG